MAEGSETDSRVLRRLGEMVVRFRWLSLALCLAATAFFGSRVRYLMSDTSMKALMVAQSEAALLQERLEDIFGLDTPFMVVIEGDVFSPEYLKKTEAFHDELAALDLELESLGKRDLRDESGKILVRARDREAPAAQQSEASKDFDGFADFADGSTSDEAWGQETGGSIVDETTSIINVRDTRFRGGGLVVEGLLEPLPDDEAKLAEKKAHALSRKSMVGNVVGEAGRHSVILVRTDFMDTEDQERVDAEIRRIGAKYDSPDFRVRYSGVPAFAAELNRMLMADVGVTNALGFVLMILLLSYMFRHPVGVIGPILVVAQSIIWTIGTMSLMRTPMTVISTILPSFLICVGIGDSVHMLSVYRQNKASGVGNREAIVSAIAHTGRPVLFTTLTTFTGLISFRFASLDAIRDFGLFGALGVLYALILSLVFLPALLTFAPKGQLGMSDKRRVGHGVSGRLLDFCNGLSRGKGRNRVLWAGVALLAVCTAGNTLVAVRHNPLKWLPKEVDARQAIETLDDHVGGSSDVSLLIEAKPGSTLKDADAMARLAKLEDHLLRYPGRYQGEPIVLSGTGLLDVLRESNWALRGEKQEAYRVPGEQRAVVDLFTLFESAAPDRLRRLMTVDAETGLMLFRLRWVDADLYQDFARYVDRGIEEIIGDKLDVHATGTVHQAIQSDNAIVGDLLRSFGLALVVITGLMILVLFDWRLGLIAMVPNLMPIAAVLAFMGLADIGIDMSNLLIASIGISIAVDDTIHFLHHFKAHYRAHGDREAAIDHAFHRAGAAMVQTSVILLGGFLVFLGATLLNLVVFGLLIALTVSFALIIDLVFAPALLRLAYPEHAREHEPARAAVA